MLLRIKSKFKKIKMEGGMLLPTVVVCNDIIKRASNEHIYLSPMKLQKMLYFLYGHYFAETDSELFSDRFIAWQYGPVILSIYDQFKKFGSNNITEYAVDERGQGLVSNPNYEPYKAYYNVFNKVWNKYAALPAITLSLLTHAKNSPWDVTLYNCPIDPLLIKKYFKGENISLDGCKR